MEPRLIATASQRTAQMRDIRLHYVERGTGDTPLVFVHGYTGSRDPPCPEN
jgi:pimeloyl-ACP methyl ester carboxylesterase